MNALFFAISRASYVGLIEVWKSMERWAKIAQLSIQDASARNIEPQLDALQYVSEWQETLEK